MASTFVLHSCLLKFSPWFSVPPNVAPIPDTFADFSTVEELLTAYISPGAPRLEAAFTLNLLEMKLAGSYLRPAEAKTKGGASQGSWCTPKLWEPPSILSPR